MPLLQRSHNERVTQPTDTDTQPTEIRMRLNTHEVFAGTLLLPLPLSNKFKMLPLLLQLLGNMLLTISVCMLPSAWKVSLLLVRFSAVSAAFPRTFLLLDVYRRF